MSNLLIVALASALAGASLWGWGQCVRRLAGVAAWSSTVSIAVGLAGVLFLGGLLNAAHLAHRAALDAVLVVGLVLAVSAGWKNRKLPWPSLTGNRLLVALPVLATGCFLATHLFPQKAFNLHDDFEKYLAHPLEMLATGTLGQNPLDTVGAETLGGQAFLHAFVAAHFPLSYLGAVDGFFCLLLCMALVGFGVPPGRWAAGALAAQCCVLAINPQVVNLSSLFTGSCLIIAAVFITGSPASNKSASPPALVLGLIYAGLLSLKGTLALFVGLHLLCFVGVGMSLGRIRPRWLLAVGGWTVVFLAPWIILHAPLYLLPPLASPQLLPGAPIEPVDFFSTAPLYWGATPLHYTAFALSGLFAAGALLWATRRDRLPVSNELIATAAAGLAAFLTYLITVAILGPMITKNPGGLRYGCAALIGAIPAGLRLMENISGGRIWSRFFPISSAAFGLLVLGAFLPSLVVRANQMRETGSPLAFLAYGNPDDRAQRAAYLSYCRDVMEGPVQSKLRRVQHLVPPGTKIVAWVMTPFWLDFQRNPIVHANLAGLGMRWARLPADTRYLLLEHTGYAVRPDAYYSHQLTAPCLTDRLIATRALDFFRSMNEFVSQAEVIHQDASYVLLRARAESPGRDTAATTSLASVPSLPSAPATHAQDHEAKAN